MDRSRFFLSSVFCMLVLGPWPSSAGIHTWDVSEVFSNADGTIQFVELHEANGGNGEGGVGNGSISSNTESFSWSNGAVPNTANRFYLVATQAFADLPGVPAPDAIIDPGSVPFFDSAGDEVSFVVYDTCTFGAVPVDGVNSYDCIAEVTGASTPTNYAATPGSITLDHVDDFQAGTVYGWGGGSGPVNQATGGPGGSGDRYLELSANNSFLGTFNGFHWSGDYLSEGVSQVEMDLSNFGPGAISLRVVLFTPGCESGAGACTAWTSTNPTALASGSGWVTAAFSLEETQMTRVLGSESFDDSLQNVERLLIRHDDGTPDPPGTGPFVTATLGLDGVTALPEPSGPIGLGAGIATLLALRRRRR